MSDSIQHKLSRVRPPRVQITYDVHTGGALEKKEIPFVVGIMAPLSAKSKKAQPPLSERKLVQIDRDNFNKVLDSICPRVAFEVPNTLTGSGKLMVSVEFNHIDDFDPVAVVQKVPKLNEIYMERSRLRDFVAKLDGNEALNGLLLEILSSQEKRAAFIDGMLKGKDKKVSLQQKLEDARKITDVKDREKAILALYQDLLDDNDSDLSQLLAEGQVILEDNQKPYALELINEFSVLLADGKNAWQKSFKRMDELATGREAKSKAVADATKALDEAKAAYDTATAAEEPKDEDIAKAKKALDETQKALDEASDVLDKDDKQFAKLKGHINIAGEISRNVGCKDLVISRQLNHIMHDNAFQDLESSWRGLFFLVMNTETNNKLKLRLLNVTREELYKDLDKAVEFDQSTLFKLIYEEEYGTYGGEPFSVLIGDYQFGRTAWEIKLLEMLSGVAAAAHAPLIASAWAKLFDMDDYANLYKPRDISKIFESAELIQWRAFREQEDSRYVTLTLPKVMLRLPYHHENNPVEGIYFDEDVAINRFKLDENNEEITDDNGNRIIETKVNKDGVTIELTTKKVDAKKVLWGNPAYILGQRITNAFSLYGWTAAIRGVEGGGLIEGLPAYTFETEDGDKALSCPTQVSITDRREKELNDLGFMSICHCKGTNKAAFFGGQTTNKPKMYLTDAATANARISSMLPYIMAASRFAHYIKVIMREKIGSFMTRQNVESYLNTWISQYVLLDDTPPQHIKAKYPLREARIDVSDIPGKPGAYKATVFLRPHFQLEELTTSIRLVAELPS